MAYNYDVSDEIGKLANSIWNFAGNLAQAEAESQANEQYHKFNNLMVEVDGAIQEKDFEALQGTVQKFQNITDVEPETLNGFFRNLMGKELSTLAPGRGQGGGDLRGNNDYTPGVPEGPGWSAGMQEAGANLGSNLQIGNRQNDPEASANQAVDKLRDSLLQSSGSSNPNSNPAAVGRNMRTPPGEQDLSAASAAAYALNDDNVKQYAQAWTQIAYAAKEQALGSVRGRTARRALEARIDGQITQGFSRLTQQAVQWKIQDVTVETMSALDAAAQGVGIGEEGLSNTEAEIDRIAGNMPYWTPAQREQYAAESRIKAQRTWLSNEASSIYEANLMSEETDFSGQRVIQPYQAEATALEALAAKAEGLDLSVEQVEAERSKITSRANADYRKENERQRLHDEALDQEMSDYFANALIGEGTPLTNELVASRKWYSYNREMQWYAKVDQLEGMTGTGGGSLPMSQAQFNGLLTKIMYDTGSATDARTAIMNDPYVNQLLDSHLEYWDYVGAFLRTDIDKTFSTPSEVDPGVVSASNSVINSLDISDFGQAMIKGEVARRVAEAEQTGTTMTNQEVERMTYELANQYDHAASFLGERLSNRDLGVYGLTKNDGRRINAYEQFGMDVAAGDFANFIFFKNGTVDLEQTRTWLREMDGDGRLKGEPSDYMGIIEAYFLGPMDAVGSLGEGYTYKAVEQVGKDFPIPVHVVTNAAGEEERYVVKTAPQDDTTVPPEARGTEIWINLDTREYAGTVATGAQLQEIQAERQAQIDRNDRQWGWRVTDAQKDEINEILGGITEAADSQRTGFGRLIAGITNAAERKKMQDAAYKMWEVGATDYENWEEYYGRRTQAEIDQMLEENPSIVPPTYYQGE